MQSVGTVHAKTGKKHTQKQINMDSDKRKELLNTDIYKYMLVISNKLHN